jgi:phosphoglycerate kinase
MGFFEIRDFASGIIDITKTMALAYWSGSKTLIGGGDALEALKRQRLQRRGKPCVYWWWLYS